MGQSTSRRVHPAPVVPPTAAFRVLTTPELLRHIVSFQPGLARKHIKTWDQLATLGWLQIMKRFYHELDVKHRPMDGAVRNGHVHMCAWLHNQGHELHASHLNMALRTQDAGMVFWLLGHVGTQDMWTNARCVDVAIWCDHKDLFIHCADRGYARYWKRLILNGCTSIIRAINSRTCISERSLEMAVLWAVQHHRPLLQTLLVRACWVSVVELKTALRGQRASVVMLYVKMCHEGRAQVFLSTLFHESTASWSRVRQDNHIHSMWSKITEHRYWGL